MKNCEHFWVERRDGYEEGCCPAICLTCGKYGCYCNFTDDLLDLISDDEATERKKRFYDLGINGNKHEIERKTEKNNFFTRFEIMEI